MTLRDGNVTHGRPRTFAFARRSFDTPGTRQGIYVLKRMPGLEYCKPSWNKTETIFRILPGLNPDDNGKTFDPFRVPEELGRYGTWQCCYEAVRNFGDPGVTFLLHKGDDPSYNSYSHNPCWVIYRAIKDACEKGQGRPEWFPLIAKSGQKRAALSAPQEITLVQALGYRFKGKDLYGDGKPPYGYGNQDPLPVWELSKSASDALFNLLDEEVVDWKGDPEDSRRFKHGDPVGIGEGLFVHIYEMGTDFSGGMQTQQAAPINVYQARPQAGAYGTKKARDPIGYGCHLTKTLDGSATGLPASLAAQEAVIKSKVRFWDDILLFMSDEEQAHLINPLFPPSAILYAFRDCPDWILPETKKAAVGAVSVPVVDAPPSRLERQADWQQPATAPTTGDSTMAVVQRALAGDPAAIEAMKVMYASSSQPYTSGSRTTMPVEAPVNQLMANMYGDPVEDSALPVGGIPEDDDNDDGALVEFPPVAKPAPAVDAHAAALEAARQRAALRSRTAGS